MKGLMQCMNINYSKILSEKNKHNYSSMATDTVVPFFNNMNRLLTESDDIIKKYLPDICKNPLGASFIKYYTITENMNVDDISYLLERLGDDNSHKDYLNSILEYKNSMDFLRVETLYNFACKRYSETCLYESSYTTDLSIIGYNINTSPETIDRYAKLLTRIEVDDYDKVVQAFPQLLKTNTNIVLGLKIVLSGQVANLILSMPLIITKRLINEGNKTQQKAFIKMINANINDIIASLKHEDARHYNMYSAYLDSLEQAKNDIQEHLSVVRESMINEHIAQMVPDIIMYEDGVLDDPIAELEELITNIAFDDSSEISEESLISLTRIANRINNEYEIIEENKLVRKTAMKASRASQKVASKAASISSNNKQTKHALKKGVDPFTNAISKYVNDLKAMDTKERRTRIITGEFRFKLIKTLKRIIQKIITTKVGIAVMASGGGILTVLGGLAIVLIGFIGTLAVDKALDDKVRRQLIRELEEELAVVNEKLEDSRSDSAKEKKYQLIRIKKKLEGDLERVKYNLKSS